MNKQIQRDLMKYRLDATDVEEPNGQELRSIITISRGHKNTHDSGYPFIQVFGVEKGTKKLVDLGLHDHLSLNIQMNMDSPGINIFRFWPLYSKTMRIKEPFIRCSTLSIGDCFDNDDILTVK